MRVDLPQHLQAHKNEEKAKEKEEKEKKKELNSTEVVMTKNLGGLMGLIQHILNNKNYFKNSDNINTENNNTSNYEFSLDTIHKITKILLESKEPGIRLWILWQVNIFSKHYFFNFILFT